MSDAFEAIKRARARAQATRESGDPGAKRPSVTESIVREEELSEPRRTIGRIERELYATRDLIFVFGFSVEPSNEIEFVVDNPTLAPVLAWCYSHDVSLDNPTVGLGPAVDQSAEAIDQRKEAMSKVRGLVEELEALEGVSFRLLWAIRGETKAHLDFSADVTEHWALNSVAEMAIDELHEVLGW